MTSTRFRPRLPAPLLALVALVAVLAIACGTAAADGDGVATIDDPAAADASASPQASVDPQEAFLAFAECMREHGVDMPDPQVGENGGVVRVAPRAGAGGPGGGDTDAFREANEACEAHLDGVVNERGPVEISPEDEQALLDFAQCMRDHGIDMPDPQFGDGGRVTIGGPADEGEGPRFDFDSDEFQAAQEACGDLLPGRLDGGGGPSVDSEAGGAGPGVQVRP